MSSVNYHKQTQFNAEQTKAITTDLKPTVVIAGAGTGKTSVLINRVIHLIEHFDIDPNKIYVLTFTNQAIFEIRQRISKFTLELPNINTCHQICLELLRKYSKKSKNFKILSDWEGTKLWKNAIDKLNSTLEEHKIFKPYDISNIYSTMQLKATSEGKNNIFDQLSETIDEQLTRSNFDLMSHEYEEQKKENNVYDLNDLLTKCNELLDESVIEEIQEDFHAILVDEFQDIDEIQFSIIKKLTQHGIHVFCVGDPDQSIYSFRGSDPKIFENFKNNYPDCRIIKLEENYRSTPEILNVANELINKNSTSEYKKTLYTKNNHGEEVEFAYAQNESDSIKWIINKILQLHRHGVPFGDIAILYRIKFHNIKIEKELNDNKIPNCILGSMKLFDRLEIKYLLSYMNLIYTNDSIAMENIINVPKRGIGKTLIKRIHEIAQDSKLTFYDTVITTVRNTKNVNRKQEKFIEFVNQIDEIKKLKDETDITFIAQRILEITNYISNWSEDEREKREKNIYKFIEEEMKPICIKQNKSIKEVVENIAIFSSGEKKSESKNSKVILSTIHQAKGLEFKYVFIINMNKGQIPYYKMNGIENKAEERRVAYVGMTRAKIKLFLCSFAESMFGDKDIHKYNQSEYINELLSFLKKVSIPQTKNHFRKFNNY